MGLFRYILGGESRRSLKKLNKMADKVLSLEEKYAKFTDEELTQEQVVELMKAALMAPTSKRSNAWQFILVDNKETLKKLSLCKEQASQFIADAALAIVVCADPLASDVWIDPFCSSGSSGARVG